MKVNLRISVNSVGLPAEFIVRDFSGNIVFYRKFINSYNVFTFCSKSKDLIFTVRPYDADYKELSKFLRLPCLRCVCAYLDFNFTAPEISLQNFTLTDANYFFPIESGVLYFTRS